MGARIEILCILSIMVLLLPAAGAQEFHTYSIKADITDNGVLEVVEITFSGISELTYVAEGEIKQVTLTSNDGGVVYNIESGLTSYVVVSNLSDKEHLKLSFFTDTPLIKLDKTIEALFKLRFPVDVQEFSFLAVLPDQALPFSTEDGFSIFPSPDNQFIDRKRYNVLWEESNLGAGDENTYSVTYTTPGRNYLPYALALFVLLGAVYWLIRSDRRKNELFFKGLGTEERKVVELLMERKEAYQHDLMKEIGLSKVKMTRVVQKLEEKGIIEKKQVGRKNKLSLII